MTKDNTNFIDPSKKTLYGKHGAEFWIGKIVAYADQKEQIEEGFGWRYKVIILGDNSETDQVEDKYYSYASVLLPTTAGTGAAFKLRSVRLSQGDLVFGVRGAGTSAPKFIIGSIPRTRKTTVTNGKFGTLSGFGYSLNNNDILDGEYNEQTGPATPGATALDPKEWTKATATNPSEKVEEIVPNAEKVNGEYKEITEEVTEKNDVKNTSGKVVDPKEWKPGTPLNTATMEALKESFDKGELPPATWEAALKQASEQGLDGYEEYVIKEEIKEEVKPKILDYKQRLEEALSKGNFDAWERSVLNVDNTTIRDDGTVVPEFLLARTMNYRRDLVRKRDSLISSIEFDKRNIGQTLNDVVLITQESINESERRLEELNNEIASIEERGTIFD